MTYDEIIQLIRDLVPFLIPIVLVQIGLFIYAILDLRKRNSFRGSKTLWAVLLVLGFFSVPTGMIIAAIYLLYGRRTGEYDDQD